MFSVEVDSTGASVSVSEGVVGVSRDSGAADEVDVTAGQTATTAAAPGSPISVSTGGTTPATLAPSKGLKSDKQGLSAAPSVDSGSSPVKAAVKAAARAAARVAVKAVARAVAKVPVRSAAKAVARVVVKAVARVVVKAARAPVADQLPLSDADIASASPQR